MQRPLTGPVRAEPLPSEKRAAAPATPQRRQRGPEEEEEEEDEDEEGGPAAAPVFQGAAHKLGEPGDEHQQPAEGHTEGKKNQ